MTQAHHLQRLFESSYRRRIQAGAPSATSLLPFLSVPLDMRLVLLCLFDGATLPQIKAALPYAKETDIRLTSHRMKLACRLLDDALADPWGWIYPNIEPEGFVEAAGDLGDPSTPFPLPDRLIFDDTDRQLRQIFYSSVPVLLFGEAVPDNLPVLSVRARCILYCLTVEELRWLTIQEFLCCSEWSIRRAIKDAEAALGGI